MTPADIHRCPGHMRLDHDNDGNEIETVAPECMGCQRQAPADHPHQWCILPPIFDDEGRCPLRK